MGIFEVAQDYYSSVLAIRVATMSILKWLPQYYSVYSTPFLS